MSLSSTELNYLVWRYLQESGFELAAYAFDKQASCSSFEDHKNPDIVAKIESGFLVNLVQKGLLYSLTEEELRENPQNRSEILTFFGSLLKEEKDVEFAENFGTLKEESSQDSKASKQNDQTSTDFVTTSLSAGLNYDESLLSKWHPSLQVLSYIKGDSNLLISAITDNKIVESATLKGPGLDKVNEITALSWSPLGNLVTTANVMGDLCSWSPDGNLRNITKGITLDGSSSAVILDINWCPNGQYFVTGDSRDRICLWNSTNLQLIQEINSSTKSSNGWGFCWLDDSKFAVSAATNSIKIMNIISHSVDFEVKTLAEFKGHEGIATNLQFDKNARLLASFSPGDNLIKLWSSNSSSPEAGILNDDTSKILPVLSLDWTSSEPDKTTLISVSIDGTVRIWDVKEQKLHHRINIFTDESIYKFEDDKHSIGQGSLVYSASLSPNGKWLAIGDDTGRVTVLDVSSGKCRGIFDHVAPDGSILDPESGNGICDICWDSGCTNISVSYKGSNSVVLQWTLQ